MAGLLQRKKLAASEARHSTLISIGCLRCHESCRTQRRAGSSHGRCRHGRRAARCRHKSAEECTAQEQHGTGQHEGASHLSCYAGIWRLQGSAVWRAAQLEPANQHVKALRASPTADVSRGCEHSHFWKQLTQSTSFRTARSLLEVSMWCCGTLWHPREGHGTRAQSYRRKVFKFPLVAS